MSTVKEMAEGYAELVAQGHGDVEVLHLHSASGATDDDLSTGYIAEVGEDTEFMDGPICDLEPGTFVCLVVS